VNKQKYEEIKKIFRNNKGFSRTKDIIDAGIHTSYLYQLTDDNVIRKIKRGLYYWNDYKIDVQEELVEVAKIIPKGVICLLSALSYYEMTTYNPWEYYIAIHRDDFKPSIPDYPPIKVFYFAEKQYRTGIKEISIQGNIVKIYDLEKTICDCIRYRNKIGIDIVKEALNEYIKKKEKNINKLIEYAKITGVYSITKKYFEVLL
jgi:predicted transcriptional regulator of viral defense system